MPQKKNIRKSISKWVPKNGKAPLSHFNFKKLTTWCVFLFTVVSFSISLFFPILLLLFIFIIVSFEREEKLGFELAEKLLLDDVDGIQTL